MRAYQDAQMRLDDALASVNQQRNRGSLLTGLMQFAKEQNMPGVFVRRCLASFSARPVTRPGLFLLFRVFF